MTIKIGDLITVDGEELKCTGEILHINAYWFSSGNGSYYSLRQWSHGELEAMKASGRLVEGKKEISVPGKGVCTWGHAWRRYRGLNKVMDVCDCGAERPVDWKDVGDKKK